MKSMSFYAMSGCLIAITLLVGIGHGRLSGRWGARPDVVSAAQRLKQLPPTIGEWELQNDTPLDPAVTRMLQCHGSLHRVYQNVKTGDVVSFFVLLGPPGPTAVHTPEICYSTKNYRITQARTRWTLDDSQMPLDEFWDLRLEANDVSRSGLRTLYGWTNTQHWQATESPRFYFGGSPYLYKLQVAAPLPTEGQKGDVCREFLTALLPVLRKQMIVSQ
jgi:Protein of unknown function (DUF3485).